MLGSTLLLCPLLSTPLAYTVHILKLLSAQSRSSDNTRIGNAILQSLTNFFTFRPILQLCNSPLTRFPLFVQTVLLNMFQK